MPEIRLEIIGKNSEEAKLTRAIRAKSGLSQIEFAGVCGVSQGTISKVEAGEFVPSLELFRAMAKHYGRDPSARKLFLQYLFLNRF